MDKHTNNQLNQNTELNQENQIHELSKKRNRRRILKRVLSFVCAAVILLTMNGLKRLADTLERKPDCGYTEHLHSSTCFDESGNLVCGMVEHVHTDACYQTRPSDDVEVLAIDSDADVPVEEVDLELGDLVLDVDADALVVDDVVANVDDVAANAAEPAPAEEEKYYILGESAKVSTIIKEMELGIKRKQIEAVGAIENDDSQIGLIRVDALEKDWLVTAERDFDEAELAIVLADDIVVVKLRDGRAPVTPVEPVTPADSETPDIPVEPEVSVEEEQTEEPAVEQPEQPAVDEQPIEVEQVEVPAIEEPAQPEQPVVEEEPAEVQGQPSDDADPAEEAAPAEEQPTDEQQPAEEAAPTEETTPVEEAVPTEGAAPAEKAAPAEDAAPVEEQPTEEAPVEEAAPVEEQPVEGAEAPAEEAAPVDEEQPEQPAEEAEALIVETEVPVVVATEEQGEEAAPATEQGEEAAPAEVQGEEAAPAEEQSEDTAPTEEQGEEQGEDAAPAEEHGEDAQEPEESVPTEEQTEEVAPVEEQGEDAAPAEEEGDEAAPVEEQGEEAAPAEEQGEEAQQPEEAAPGEEQGEEAAPTEDQGEEGAASGEEQGEEAEPAEDEQGEDAVPTEEAAEGEAEEQAESEAEDQQPESQTYTATLDLADVETYPLSLNAMLTAAMPQEPVEEEPTEEQQEGEEPQEPTLTIVYDEALLEVVEQDGDYLVTPIQSFESALIIVENGSRFELTLVNCVLPTDEEQEAEEQHEEEAAAVYTATIDLTDATYPLSLNAMLTAAMPDEQSAEEQNGEEQTVEDQPAEEEQQPAEEEQAEEQPQAQSTLTIEYDEELIEIAEAERDHLIAPNQSFESTQIIVNNGSRFELTLVNCVLTDDGEEEAVAYPAQTFEDHTDYVKVSVSAPEGAFPEGTTMTIADVDDEQTISDIEDTVSADFVEVKRVHAVDISFYSAEGTEIEPLVPISVVITVAEIEQQQDAVVVHVDQEGATEVVESQNEAPAGETEVTMEMPAASDAPTEEGEQPAEEQGEQEPQPPEEQQGEESRTFTADSFSVYAVVVTETIETRYIDESGETWKISVGYGEAANIPAGATLKVAEVTDETYLTEAEAALEGGKRVTMARFFDISIVDAEGAEVQPAVPVTVNISLDNTEVESIEAAEHVIDNSDPVAVAMHFEENDGETTVDMKETTEAGEAVVFDAASFSVWGVVYTVDFYYGDYEYHINGESSVTLSALFEALEIEADAAQATDVVFSNPELVAVRKIEEDTLLSSVLAELGLGGEEEYDLFEEQSEEADEIIAAVDWLLVSLAPFDSHETLTVTMEDGTVYEIRVEDAQYNYKARFSAKEYAYFSSGGNNLFAMYSNGSGYQHVQDVMLEDGRIVAFTVPLNGKGYSATANSLSGGHFAMWVKIQSDGTITRINEATLSDSNRGAVSDTNFVAYTVQDGVKIVVVEPYTDTSEGTVTKGKKISDDNDGTYPTFYYSTDTMQVGNETRSAFFRATPASGYYFKGWYDSNENLIATTSDYSVSSATEDLLLHAEFAPLPKYKLVSNKVSDAYTGYFQIDWSSGPQIINPDQEQTAYYSGSNIILRQNMDISSVPSDPDRYDFAFWLRDDGVSPTTKNNSQLNKNNVIDRDTTYICFFAPKGQHIVRVNEAEPAGDGVYTSSSSGMYPRSVTTTTDSKEFLYYFTNDVEYIRADKNRTGYTFIGWYNNYDPSTDTGTLVSTDNTLYFSTVTTNLNLTPVYEPTLENRNYYNVWFDGSNGIGGGDVANNTLYTRIESTGNVQGSTSVRQEVPKSNNTITLPSTAVAPQSQGDNNFVLQGWYDIYNKHYYQPGAPVTITSDSVFYADWAPSSYAASSDSSVASLDTNGWITTFMFDYNNLFNMDSIQLDASRSFINKLVNSERWKVNGNSSDFVFISTVSGFGRSLNPDNRQSFNSNNETTTNGTYYSGQVSAGLLTSNLRSRLFGTSSDLGKYYLGRANYLYQYDPNTGYYYYDSDKNAAGYNKAQQRFYIYNYTNATDKSGGLDGDFLPYNYGNTTFTEAWGAPNYWFGMSSQIRKFYLPNATGFQDSEGAYGNRSVKDDEMVFKFAGDDDVWVFVDGNLVLDMGGIHGKVYGEINFSRGTWAVVSNGASKVNDNQGIMSYVEGTGSKTTGTINLAEGDHSLTIYYLERGSSQSNCAIYFNLAPRYRLKLHKADNGTNANLAGAQFGIYSDAACTMAAKVTDTATEVETNIFTTDSDGYIDVSDLVAGKTYYLKELVAPSGYPDVSEEVITLTLDSHGNPTVYSTADKTGDSPWTMATVTSSEDGPNPKGTFILSMEVKNRQEVSITAQKIWAMLDGSNYTRDENCNVTVKLQRYQLIEGEGDAVSYKVRLISRYFEADGKPTNRDTGSKVVYSIQTEEVQKGGSITFTASAGNGAGIASVASQYGAIASSNITGTGSQQFYINGGWSAATQQGTYTLSNVQRDTDIYITFIGYTDNPEYLGMMISNIQKTNGSGTRYRKQDDATFNSQTTVNDQAMEVTLNKGNNWKTTWTNLVSTADQIQYYYYVKEISSTSDLSQNPLLTAVDAYVETYSSDGLSGGGTITVRNTLNAIKVKLRKKDVSANENLAGVEFKIYTQAEANAVGFQVGQKSVIETNASIWLEKNTYDSTKEVFVSNNDGWFYTGYLPLGTYYIYETGGYEGYDKLEKAVVVNVSENGLQYKLDPDEESWSTRHLDNKGYYNLYIDNTRKLDTETVDASVSVDKVDENSEALGGATFTLYNTNNNGNLSGVVKTYAGGSFSVSTEDVISQSGEPTRYLRDLLASTDSLTLYLKETAAPTGYTASNSIYTITITKTVTGPVRNIAKDAFVTTTTYGMTINGNASASVPNTPFPGDLELTKRLTGTGADETKPFAFTVALTLPAAVDTARSFTTTLGGSDSTAVTVAANATTTTATITLTKDQTWKINDLPAGTTYVITETDYSAEGYTSSIPAGGLTGTIQGKTTEKEAVEVTNTHSVGGLTVEKTLSGNAVDTSKDFTFQVTFRGNGLSDNYGSYKKGNETTIASATANSITFAEGVSEITFTLKGGEKAEFTNLPTGTTFTVEEISADADGYETTVTSNGGTVNADKTVTGAIGSGTVVTASYVNAKNTTTRSATKAWKSGAQTIVWPEDVESVEFTLYKTVNEQTTVVDTTDVTGIVNPAEVTANTANKTVYWANLPTRYLVSGTWYDATYTVEETKVVYTDGTELTTSEAISAAFSPTAKSGTYTNNIPKVNVDVTKRWTNPSTPPTGTEVTVVLSAAADGSPYTLTAVATEQTISATTTPTAWYYQWTDLPKYDDAGHLITYTVAETAVEYGDVTYNSESDIALEEMFQITTVQPTDGHATITNQLKQTQITVLKESADEPHQALPGAEFTLERKGSNDIYTPYGAPQTSGSDGMMTFSNLPDGDYRLMETGIPAGYARTSSGTYIYFTIGANGVTRTYSGDSPILANDNSVSYVNNQFTVYNTPGVALPATGGPGTTLYYATGVALLLLAIALLLRRKARDVIE